MARYKGPKGKIVRKFGINIFGSPKFDNLLRKKPQGPGKPGQGGMKRKKMSVYATQLLEKQKLKYMYGVLERQFRKYYEIAKRKKGITGDNLIKVLESRLDNIIYRMHLATSRDQARQIVLHRHIEVNGRVVNIPSYQVKVNDVITVKEKSKKLKVILESLKLVGTSGVVPWLDVDADNASGVVKQLPRRSEITDLANINEQLVIELYSK